MFQVAATRPTVTARYKKAQMTHASEYLATYDSRVCGDNC